MHFPSPVHILNRLSPTVITTTLSSIRETTTVKPDAIHPKDLDVDPNTGFFPPKPLPRLPQKFELWERALVDARRVLTLAEDHREESIAKRPEGELWRGTIRSWPVLNTSILHDDIRYLQRAHMVLATMMHFYVHSMPAAQIEGPIHIPQSLAVPLVEVSTKLGMAPVLTFADTVLWNWDLINPELPLSIENMRYVNIFSGTTTENNFYLTSAAVELKGVEMLRLFEGLVHLRDTQDAFTIAKISQDLKRLAKIIEELISIFQSIRDTVDPHEFYWACRPWWSGATSKSSSHPGWVLDGVPDASNLDLGGASAGQSSVMHALDIFLDIDHKLEKNRVPAPSPDNQRSDRGFMERMRRYMPGKHRLYLERLASAQCSVREVAQQIPSLIAPYNTAVMALKKLRDVHIRIVVLYVVTKADSPPEGFGSAADVDGERRHGPIRGTGGSDVCNFLKAGRDATRRTVLMDAI
ncbi:Indoleamine 2,3-dioxygenase [Sparassis latifolia]